MSLSEEQKAFLLNLAKSIKRWRHVRGFTQQKLAELADLDIRTVQKIEAGELNLLITTVQRIKQALGINWDDLLG